MQNFADERGDQVALAALRVGSCRRAAEWSGSRGLRRVGAARMQLEDGETERLGEWQVLALGICDRDPPAEHGRPIDATKDLTAVLLPMPTSPATITFGFVSSPSAYAVNGS